MKASSWTSDRLNLLRTLHAQNVPAGQIARQLGGTTRNAVLGKIFRLGLSSRMVQVIRKPKRPLPNRRTPYRTGTFKPSPYKARTVDPAAPASREISIYDLDCSTCKFPSAEAPFSFCGHPVDGNKPYCAAHAALTYAPPPRERVEAAA